MNFSIKSPSQAIIIIEGELSKFTVSNIIHFQNSTIIKIKTKINQM